MRGFSAVATSRGARGAVKIWKLLVALKSGVEIPEFGRSTFDR